MEYKYIYGPVPSRRLGHSLGVDMISFKNCSFNCIYCQLGSTTNLTMTRKKYAPIHSILTELKDILQQRTRADFITLSGAGDPTLHSELGLFIHELKMLTSIPVAVLTNSSLIERTDVQDDLLEASVTAPTLCTTQEATFQKIHRAHADIHIERIINGLIAFREKYTGRLWLEIMLIKGINDSEGEILRLKRTIRKIRPDKVHLNTVIRPPSESCASPLSSDDLERVRTLLGGNAEIIAAPPRISDGSILKDIESRIFDVIRRRPVSIKDLATITGLSPHEVAKYVATLVASGMVKVTKHGGESYYEKK